MTSKHDYHSLLLRAVSGLDRDAYAARGAVYDREHKALLRRLFASDSQLTDAEIDEEQAAFREAVGRIESAGRPDVAPSLPEPAPVAPPPPMLPLQPPERIRPAAPEAPRTARKIDWTPRGPASGVMLQRPIASLSPPLPAPESMPPDPAIVPERDDETAALDRGIDIPRQRRSVFGRVALRTLLAVVLISLGLAGYGYVTGQLKLPWLAGVVGERVPSADGTAADTVTGKANRAILFDGELTERAENQAVGTATWRSALEPGRDTGVPVPVLYLDAAVPQRKLFLKLSMLPEVPGGVMSHLINLRFVREDGRPDADIVDVGGLVTRTSREVGRASLAGSMIRVTQGVFLFGLNGQAGARELSMRQLKDMRWLDLPLTHRNGGTAVLAVEIGDEGRKVISEVLSKWER